jgi:hypothetical protein
MFALVRFIARRISKNRLGKSVLVRRVMILVAVVRFVLRVLDRPQVIRLRKNESATVSVAQLGSKES